MKKFDIKGMAIKAATTGAGAVAGGMLNKIGFVANQKPLIRGLIKIVAGSVLPAVLAKGKKSEMFSNIGNGMVAVGALEVANGFLPDGSKVSLSGVPTMPSLGYSYLQGAGMANEQPTLGNAVAFTDDSFKY